MFVSKRLLAVLAVCLLVPAPVAAAGQPAPQVSTTLVVHEVYTHGPGGEHDEFIEIRNISTLYQDLTDMELRFYSPTCQKTNVVVLNNIVLSPANNPGEFLVITGSAFTGSIAPNAHIIVSSGSGAVGLLDSSAGAAALFETNRRVDGVAWAPPSAQRCRMERSPARLPPRAQGLSISRDVLGTDTDDNRLDFHIAMPGAGLLHDFVELSVPDAHQTQVGSGVPSGAGTVSAASRLLS